MHIELAEDEQMQRYGASFTQSGGEPLAQY